jgi:hypothetical protein
LELDTVSRAQTVWAVSALAAAAIAFALLSLLPFSFWLDAAIAGLAFWFIAGAGHRYFLRHATPSEIRHDLEGRKNSPG